MLLSKILPAAVFSYCLLSSCNSSCFSHRADISCSLQNEGTDLHIDQSGEKMPEAVLKKKYFMILKANFTKEFDVTVYYAIFLYHDIVQKALRT